MPLDEQSAKEAPSIEDHVATLEDRVAALEAKLDRALAEIQRHVGGFVLAE